jgi:arginine N-succinyltransferase
MLIGAEPLRFSDTVMAELRGWFAPDGTCPSGKGVASKFFRLPFDEADRMVMSTDGQFILDLAPRHPIYVELIDRSGAGRDRPGPYRGRGRAGNARARGLSRSGLIDIFDGGPTYSVPRDSIRTIDRSDTLPVAGGDPEDAPERLVSTTSIEGFRATRARVRIYADKAVLDTGAIDALQLKPGEMVRVRQ